MLRNIFFFVFLVIATYIFVSNGISYSITGYRNYNGKLSENKITTYKKQLNYYGEVNSKDVTDFSLSKTSEALKFKLKRDATRNPNAILNKGTGHCIMYSYVFASTFNQLCKYKKVNANARVAYGQVYFYNVNLTKLVPSSFFRTHDFNVIKDENGVFITDAILFDYLMIKKVKLHHV